jgi:hypothetical protein
MLMTRTEELDVVFSVDTKTHARFQLRQLGRFMRRNVLRQDCPAEQLYEFEGASTQVIP